MHDLIPEWSGWKTASSSTPADPWWCRRSRACRRRWARWSSAILSRNPRIDCTRWPVVHNKGRWDRTDISDQPRSRLLDRIVPGSCSGSVGPTRRSPDRRNCIRLERKRVKQYAENLLLTVLLIDTMNISTTFHFYISSFLTITLIKKFVIYNVRKLHLT